MSQALHLMNAPEIAARLSSAQGRITQLTAAGKSPQEIFEALTLAAWTRLPNDRERRAAARVFEHSSQRQACEDLLWAILNSYDFLFIR